MIEQIFADRRLDAKWNIDCVKYRSRPDTGSHQDRGRMDRAGTQNYLAAFDPAPITVNPNSHGESARAVELDSIDHRITKDRKISVTARTFKVAVIG